MDSKKVLDHFLVPKHEIVPQEKIEEVLKEFNASLKKLPQVLADDPAIMEIGAVKGDLIKITRKSPTAGKSIFFRVVV